MSKITVTREVEVTDRQLRDVLGTALEGGIGYWSRADNIRKIAVPDDSLGWQYDAVDLEIPEGGDDGEPMVYSNLNADVIRRGIELMLADTIGHPHWEEGNQFLRCLLTEDEGIEYVDATVADMLVQYGIFGKVVYG